MVYGDPAEGWWCFGCDRGGSIYDLASLLERGAWGRELRGHDFQEVKWRVHARLGLEPVPEPGGRARDRSRAAEPTTGARR